MCGIAGCVGHDHAPSFVVDALETLQYRGYDSAGLAYVTGSGIEVVKAIDTPSNLRDKVDLEHADQEALGIAIGHTRWATHGPVNIPNTHPHTNSDGTVASVCNGTIENYKELRRDLTDNGYVFTSQTDTEVIAHLFDYYLKEDHDPEAAFRKTLLRLSGSYAVLLTSAADPEALYAARFYSPLVLGLNGDEQIAASDTTVFAEVRKAVYLDDKDMVRLTAGSEPHVSHTESAERVSREPQDIDDIREKVDKGEHPHFMLKEIFETPETVRNAIAGRVLLEDLKVKLGGLDLVEERLRDVERFVIVACGTSHYAALIGERLIEEVAGIPVEVEDASEFIYKDQPFDTNTAIVAVSQSGETADTLRALEKADELGMLKLGIVNSLGSSIYRETDAGVYCHAGPEIAVASTKAFVSQVTILAEIAILLAKRSNSLNKPLIEELTALPDKIEELLADTSDIQAAAKKYSGHKNFMYIGRGYNFPVALEGGLKLMEIGYINTQRYSAGEMKHGPMALIDEDFPTFAIATDGAEASKMLTNIEEIQARNGPVIALATAGNKAMEDAADDVIYVPGSLEQTQPILNAIALQLFAYYVAVEKGLNVDRPRNLAKSVTVE